METFKISAVVAAAEQKSLSKAAEMFLYTPSAFSHLVSAFEEELGVRLFERSSTGVRLTKEGEALMPSFRALLESEAQLRTTAAALAGRTDNELTICTYSSMSRSLLSGIIQKLRKDYPHLTVSVHVVDTLCGWLDGNKADMIFADDAAFGDREWFALFDDVYYVLAPKGFMKENDSVTVEELYKYPYIHTDNFNLHRYLDLERFEECIHYNSIDDTSIIKAVRDGLGITVMPQLVFKGFTEGVEVLKLHPEIKRAVGCWVNEKRMRELHLTKFVSSLKV